MQMRVGVSRKGWSTSAGSVGTVIVFERGKRTRGVDDLFIGKDLFIGQDLFIGRKLMGWFVV